MLQRTHTFISKNKDSYDIKLPAPMQNDSFFIFSLVKAGSTLVNGIIKDLCHFNDIPVVSIFDSAFTQGVATNDIEQDIDRIILPKGYAYLGFRHFFNFTPSINLSPLKKVLLIRDPRDILTSLYFSVKHSHMVPKTGRSRDMMLKRKKAADNSDIDVFVLKNAQSILNSYQSYVERLSLNNWYIYKYEDIIEQKETWITALAGALELKLTTTHLADLLTTYDVFPMHEQVDKHVRQVMPGNHKKHLKTDTIDQLNVKFTMIMSQFGYS